MKWHCYCVLNIRQKIFFDFSKTNGKKGYKLNVFCAKIPFQKVSISLFLPPKLYTVLKFVFIQQCNVLNNEEIIAFNVCKEHITVGFGFKSLRNVHVPKNTLVIH